MRSLSTSPACALSYEVMILASVKILMDKNDEFVCFETICWLVVESKQLFTIMLILGKILKSALGQVQLSLKHCL